MNHSPTFGIFGLLLMAYCTATQGQVIPVAEEMVENGERYVASPGGYMNFVRVTGDTYNLVQIEHENGEAKTTTVGTFEIEGMDTMIERDLVLRTKNNSYVQIEMSGAQAALKLFVMTVRPKLGESLYSYKVYAVYEYEKGRILNDVSISGFVYSTTGNPQQRFVIHSGKALATELQPHLLWTEEDFNYHAYGNSVILVLRAKPAYKRDRYFLVNFCDASDQDKWMTDNGRYQRKTDIPPYPWEAFNYFRGFIGIA